MRKELLLKFDDAGLFHNHVMGMKETNEEIIFFLADNETIDTNAVCGMKDFGYDNDLQFIGVNLETEKEKIVIDEFFKNNCSYFDDEMCMIVKYKKN